MSNPIGMGVNYNCPMDIGIRNGNILIAIDWLKQTDHSVYNWAQIEATICTYVIESTKHILRNLEYRDGLTSNHYLGNIMGVLAAGAYLEQPENQISGSIRNSRD